MSMGPLARLSPVLCFQEAFDVWIAQRTVRHATLTTNVRYISPRTEHDYRQYALALNKFFCGMRLEEIGFANLRAYHHDRAFCEGAWARQAGANLIRKEVAMLVRMLRSAGLWGEGEDRMFERLAPVEIDVPRAMSAEEQFHFLEVAGSREDWQWVYQYSIAGLQTCMSTNELRGLRIGDVMLAQGVVQVRWATAKNKFRVRTIPIETQESRWAFESLMWRAHTLGAGAPHHYLFPFGERGGYSYDPMRPMSVSGIRRKWDEIRCEAGLQWLRPYDLRHTAITRMAENGVPIAVIMSFAGHMTLRMQQHYTAVALMAKRKAVASTWSGTVPKPSCVSVALPPVEQPYQRRA